MSIKIKLINENTDLSKLKISKMDWDTYLGDEPYYVVMIEEYYHSTGGRYGDNNLWAYPRKEEISVKNLVPFLGEPVCWGLLYKEKNCWGDEEIIKRGGTTITRNGKPFYFVYGNIEYSVLKAKILIDELQNNPVWLNEIDYDKKIIGRKVWWRSQPAIVTRWIDGQACVILKPDGIKEFEIPNEFKSDNLLDNEEDKEEIKADIFDKHIWWFRE